MAGDDDDLEFLTLLRPPERLDREELMTWLLPELRSLLQWDPETGRLTGMESIVQGILEEAGAEGDTVGAEALYEVLSRAPIRF